MVSTANGRSNPESGEGNEFHRRWIDTESGYTRIFLPYDVHPERDENWYETASEVRELKVHQRQEQYPREEGEAFALSDRNYFDAEALLKYSSDASRHPRRRFDFEPSGPSKARLVEHENGKIRVFREPVPDRDYAIGADVATGAWR
jgi:hypothetical protein